MNSTSPTPADFLGDPLSNVSRRERRNLLASSTIAVLIAQLLAAGMGRDFDGELRADSLALDVHGVHKIAVPYAAVRIKQAFEHFFYAKLTSAMLSVAGHLFRRGIGMETIAWNRTQRGDALLMRPLILHASGRSTSDRHRRILHIEYAGNDLPDGLHWNHDA